jgi:hypothetical protein
MVITDFLETLYVDEAKPKDDGLQAGTCESDSDCDRLRRCAFEDDEDDKKSTWGKFTSWVSSWFSSKKKEKKNGKCKGWPTRQMKKVYMYSLEKFEQDG